VSCPYQEQRRVALDVFRGSDMRNLFRPSVFLLGLVVAACLHAVPARADIYAWRDEHGRLVLSKQPAPPGVAVRTFAVHGNDAFRTTGAAATAVPLERRLRAAVVDHAARHALDPDLVRAVIRVESGWNPRAVSRKGAMGLMQLMPATAAEYGVADPFDPDENIRAGVAYLRRLIDRFDGRTELALAAYNAGPGAVEKYRRTVPPYRETQSYVKRIVSVTEVRVGPRRTIYKIVELIDGREVPRYSDRKPDGAYELVTNR
jgi:soluble lytic murein transglycosylase-like protein